MKQEIRLYEDPNLVTYRTDLEGWTGPDNLYYGKGEEGERRARYANATHRTCECGGVKPRDYSCCDTCRQKKNWERYLALEEQEWMDEYLAVDDKYFSSLEEFLEWCEEEELDPKEVEVYICEKNYRFREINIDEMNEEYCTEYGDQSFSDFHPEIAQKVEEINKILRELEPKLWFPSNKRPRIWNEIN